MSGCWGEAPPRGSGGALRGVSVSCLEGEGLASFCLYVKTLASLVEGDQGPESETAVKPQCARRSERVAFEMQVSGPSDRESGSVGLGTRYQRFSASNPRPQHTYTHTRAHTHTRDSHLMRSRARATL